MILPVLFSRWLFANRWSMIALMLNVFIFLLVTSLFTAFYEISADRMHVNTCCVEPLAREACLIIRCPDHVVSIYQRYVSEIKSDLTHPITYRILLNLISNLNWKISTVFNEFNWFINECHCYLKKINLAKYNHLSNSFAQIDVEIWSCNHFF